MRLPGGKLGFIPACLVLFLLLGFCLRFAGLTRGESSVEGGRAFHHFHPDETTLVRAALGPIDPFAPGLTSYGTLPVYLLRGVLELDRFVSGRDFEDQDSTGSVRYVYLTARTLAALISCLTLWLVWLLGRRWFGEPAGLLAVLMVAAAPMAIQAAHFYTVDGLFTLLVLAALVSLLHGLDRDDLRWFLATGALAGLAGAVRLAGLSVGVVLAAGLLLRRRRDPGAALVSPAGAAGLGAALVLIALQPFLVTDPELISRYHSADDLGYAVKVAQGEILRLWTLTDVHTVPYLHHWTHLWPLGVGWPLALLFVLGVLHALRRPDHRKGLILLWAAGYFALIGGLHAKPIRYLLPMLPLLAVLAAHACVRLGGPRRSPWPRRLAIGAAAAALVHGTAYGVAFAGLYTREDSRLQAARWIDEQVPAGSRIGLETGAFSMRGLVDRGRYGVRTFNTVLLFEARGYATCGTELTWLRDQFQDLDYLAILDVNRYRQFTAAPGLIPGGAAFYEALVDERLGFDLVQRFKHHPSLGGLEFRDDGSEPSFSGYDHPAVMIFRKRDDAAWQQGLARLSEGISTSPHCVDPFLEKAASALQAGDLQESLTWTRRAIRERPRSRIAHLIEAHLLSRTGGAPGPAAQAYHADLRRPDRIPAYPIAATGMSLFELGLNDLAMGALGTGVSAASRDGRVSGPLMARLYVRFADHLHKGRGLDREAADVLLLSTRIHPLASAWDRLAKLAPGRGDPAPSADPSIRVQAE